MLTIANTARERLAAGQLALGMALRQARTVDYPTMEKYVRKGARFVLCGSDISFIMAGGQARAEFLRGIKA